MCREKTKCEAGRICGADRHWSVLITWQIRIVTFSSRFEILTLTLTLITDPQIGNFHRSDPPRRFAPPRILLLPFTHYYLLFHLLNLAPANLQQRANPLRDVHYETHMHHARTYFINICHIIFTYMSNVCQCMWTMCHVCLCMLPHMTIMRLYMYILYVIRYREPGLPRDRVLLILQ